MKGAFFKNVPASDTVFLEVGRIRWEVYQVFANEHGSSFSGSFDKYVRLKMDMD